MIREIIKTENIKDEHIVFILNRNYKMDFVTTAKVLDFSPLELQYNNKDTAINELKKYLASADALLNNNIKSKFIAYIPNSVIPLTSLIMTSKRCYKFSYVEEGIIVYYKKHFEVKTNYFLNLKLYLRGLSRIKHINANFFQLNHRKLLNCYTVSELGFVNFKRKIVFNNLFRNEHNEDSSTKNILIIFDALLVRNIVDSEFYYNLLSDIIIPFVKENYQNILFKFHPEQIDDVEHCNKILQLLNNNLPNIEELQDINLETYVSNNKIDLVNFISSTGFYANLAGNDVYSVMERLETRIGTFGLDANIYKKWIQL